MHSPSMLTPLLANQIIAEHAEAARAHRATRRARGRRFRGLFPGAHSSGLARRRTVSPFAR